MPFLPIPDFLTMAVLASASLCPNVPPPNIEVVASREPTKIRHDMTKEQLQNLRKDTKLPYQMMDLSHVETGGVLHSDIEIKHDVGFGVVPGNTADTVNQACVRYENIRITFALNPVIFIASDYTPESCWYKEIREHEESHIDMDEVVILKYAKRVQEGMKMAFSAPADFIAGPVDPKKTDPLKEKMGNDLVAMVNVLTADMGAERQEKQQGVDSLGGYAYIMNTCYQGENVVKITPDQRR